jgi:allophanate hydrolase subunit 1
MTEVELDTKDVANAIDELQIQFGNQEVAAEQIKSIMEYLKTKYGKEEADRIKKLAMLIHKDKYDVTIEEYNNIEELNEQVYGE